MNRLFARITLSFFVCTVSLTSSCGPQQASPRNPPVIDTTARAQLRERAIALLIDASSSDWAEARANAIEALAIVSTRATQHVRLGLSDENPGVRAVAAMVAGEQQLTELTPALKPLLVDPYPQARAAAIYALVRCGQSPDLTPLAAMLASDDIRVRSQAATVLGKLANPSALPMLKQADTDTPLRASQQLLDAYRLQLAEARVRLRDEEALYIIRAALYPSRSEQLESAAFAATLAGELRDHGSVDALILLTALKDDTGKLMPPEVRLAAAAALAKLGRQQGSFIADQFYNHPNATLRKQAAYVYGTTGHAQNLSTLETMLQDSNLLVRVSAAYAILQITDTTTSASTHTRPTTNQ